MKVAPTDVYCLSIYSLKCLGLRCYLVGHIFLGFTSVFIILVLVWQAYSTIKFLNLFSVYFKGRETERGGERTSICWFSPWMSTMASDGPVWSQEPPSSFWVSYSVAGTQELEPSPAVAVGVHISRKLYRQMSSHDLRYSHCDVDVLIPSEDLTIAPNMASLFTYLYTFQTAVCVLICGLTFLDLI